jgi:hypothetical protein
MIQKLPHVLSPLVDGPVERDMKLPPQQPEDFNHFLAGTIESTGSFSKNGLTILFKTQDTPQAHALKNRLGFGEVVAHLPPRANRVALKITSPEDLVLIIKKTNGKFVGHAIIDEIRQHSYDTRFGIVIQPALGKVTLENSWLSGFLDGFVAFQIVLSESQYVLNGGYFRISVFQKTPFFLILIAKCLNVQPNFTSGPNFRTSYRLDIVGKDRIKSLVNYFNNYPLQTRKALQFAIFKNCPESDKALMYQYKLHLDNVYKDPLL